MNPFIINAFQLRGRVPAGSPLLIEKKTKAFKHIRLEAFLCPDPP